MNEAKKYNSYAMEIDSGGYAFYVCYGQHSHGWFIALPTFDTCVEAGTYDDVFYNSERLCSCNNSIVKENGDYIAETICKIMKSYDFICDENNTLLEFRNINDGSYINIPNYIKAIGDGAFDNKECWKIKEITLPNGITEIGESAFENCEIENIIIPNGVRFINEWTFDNCKNLKNVTIPDSVEHIFNYAFDNCTSLKSVEIPLDCTIELKAFPADCKIILRENTDEELDLTEQERGRS